MHLSLYSKGVLIFSGDWALVIYRYVIFYQDQMLIEMLFKLTSQSHFVLVISRNQSVLNFFLVES